MDKILYGLSLSTFGAATGGQTDKTTRTGQVEFCATIGQNTAVLHAGKLSSRHPSSTSQSLNSATFLWADPRRNAKLHEATRRKARVGTRRTISSEEDLPILRFATPTRARTKEKETSHSPPDKQRPLLLLLEGK